MYLTLVTIFLSAVKAIPSDLQTTFSHNESKLAECIENQVYQFSSVLGYSFVDRKAANLIGDYVANEVSGRTLTKNKIRTEVTRFKIELGRNMSERYHGEKNLVKRLSIVITNALHMCSSDNEPKPLGLPDFEDEIPAIAKILDFILVSWPIKLKHMIRTKQNRVLLRKYINDAKQFLKCALAVTLNADHFRSLLRSYWTKRAERYYDGRNPERPYLSHRYTLEHSFPHTLDDVESQLFSNRSSQRFEDRNPMMGWHYLNKILNIHYANRKGHGEYDPFAIYKERGEITSDQYLLESAIDDFYRTFFFDEALRARGIVTDDDDVHDEELKGFDDVTEIVTDNNKYRNYLLRLRSKESNLDSPNPIRQSLGRRARVCEEELALLIMMNTPSTSGVTTCPETDINTTTATVSTSKKPEDKQSSKRQKESEYQGDNFFKRPKVDSGEEKSDSSDHNESTDSCSLNQTNDSMNLESNILFFNCFQLQFLQQLQSSSNNSVYYGYFM